MYTVLLHHFDLVAVSTATSFNVFTNFRTICHDTNAVDEAFPLYSFSRTGLVPFFY